MQPSQQHVAPCVKEVDWGLDTRGLRMVAAFWAGIPLELIQEAGVVPRRRRAVSDSGKHVFIYKFKPHMSID